MSLLKLPICGALLGQLSGLPGLDRQEGLLRLGCLLPTPPAQLLRGCWRERGAIMPCGWENRHLGVTLAKQIFAQCFLEASSADTAPGTQGPQAINGINSHLEKLTRTYVTVWLVAQQILTPPLRLCRVAPTVNFVPCDFSRWRCDLSRGLPPTCWAHSPMRAGPGLTGPAVQAPEGTQHSLLATALGRAAQRAQRPSARPHQPADHRCDDRCLRLGDTALGRFVTWHDCGVC